ncbi:regulatory protein TenI [Clostridium puniceum]|uniref:Regulatory protein TenI n=1 Tax=Clostridium puniceum TaxID=29367 RepID=A0A1S8TR75_9CLOT|nr:thiamine phosphate synthase [Clostridium puniceum]OOM80273.1 regulatory protein TenI [Clostridium puniceum]
MIIIGITNRNLCMDFYGQIRKIAKSKLNYLIIREKDLKNEKLLNLALKVKEELKDTKIKIIVNSNIDVAKKIEADGIQLSFKNFIEVNNKLYTENEIYLKNIGDNFQIIGDSYKIYKTIGVSIHSYEEGIEAYKLGADYVIYGHVFKCRCKKGIIPRGVKEIKSLSERINIPIIGLGGIDENNFKEVLNSGAKGIAIMSSLMKSHEPKELINKYNKIK